MSQRVPRRALGAGKWEKLLAGALLFLQAALVAAMPARQAVDPMTGVPLSYEAKQRRLEELRLETQLKREAVKRARAETDLALQPYKKRLAVDRLAARTAAAERARKAHLAAHRQARQQAAAKISARRLPKVPTLVGVMKMGTEFIALVSYRGQTLNVHDGGRVGDVQVTAIDDSSARLNGRRFVVQPQAGTVAVVDKQPPALPPLPAPLLAGARP